MLKALQRDVPAGLPLVDCLWRRQTGKELRPWPGPPVTPGPAGGPFWESAPPQTDAARSCQHSALSSLASRGPHQPAACLAPKALISVSSLEVWLSCERSL